MYSSEKIKHLDLDALGVIMESGYLYFLDAEGDLSRIFIGPWMRLPKRRDDQTPPQA